LTTNVNPQLCDKFDNRTIAEPMYVEPKYDGIRAVFVPQENGTVIAFSREGKRLFNTERLCELIAKSDNNKIVVDGEVFYKDFHTTQSIVSTQSEHPLAGKLQLFAFDAIPLDDWNAQTSSLPLFRRKEVLRAVVDDINGYDRPPNPTPEEVKAKLEELVKQRGVRGVQIPPPMEEPKDDSSWPVQYVPAKLIGSNPAAEAFYRECVAAGFEGIILKEYAAHYEYKRSKTWMKMKPSHDTDITIVDAIEGNHRLVGSLGALIVEGSVTFNNRPYKVRSEVGSGFTDPERQKLWNLHKAGELVGRIVEVRYQEPDIDGALRFPVFVRLRDDRAEEAA
jgi:ATP-dependent DNA ligase